MKTVLVTGADGFTGHYMVQLLQNKGFKVIGLGMQPTEADETLICNITNAVAVKEAVVKAQPNWVVHLAAVSFVAHGDVNAMYEVNVIGTRNLLSALADLDKLPESVLLASSATIYGNRNEHELEETSPLLPANDYGVSKLAMEFAARLWMDRLPITIVRPFNYTGFGQDVKFLIPKIVDHFVRRECYIELGNINVEREFSDVRVVCQQYMMLLEASSAGETFNICAGEAYSLIEILTIMSGIAGYEIDVRINPAFVRSNEIKRLVGSNKKLHSSIGEQVYPSIKETLNWMYDECLAKMVDQRRV